jgi:hypothetical protein
MKRECGTPPDGKRLVSHEKKFTGTIAKAIVRINF